MQWPCPHCQADGETVLDKDVFSGLDQIAARQAADEAVAADPKAAANSQALEAVFALQNYPLWPCRFKGLLYIYIWFIYIYTVYGILYGIHIYVYMLFSCSELSISIDQYMLQPWLDQNHLLQVHAIDASEVGKDPGASSWFEGQLCPVWVQWAEPWIAHISHLNDYVMTDIFFGCV
jgi:hypothetical protein